MTRTLNGITVLDPEILLILKQKAYEARAHSPKGEKDKIDMIALLQEEVGIKKYKILLKRFNKRKNTQVIKKIISRTREVPELGMTEHKFSKFKKRILSEL